MIGEVAFKGFCSRVAEGTPMRALFITPKAVDRNQQQLDMFNVLEARNMEHLYVHSLHAIKVGPAVAYLRIAHPYLDRELKGLDWHFIQGLEYLEVFEKGSEVAKELALRVRP